MRILLSALLSLWCSAALSTVTPLPGTTPQQGPAGTPFRNPLQVQVTNAAGQAEPGARVTFFVPQAAIRVLSAANCFYELGFGWSCDTDADAQGVASLGLVVADAVGHYEITVQAYSANRTQWLESTRLSFDATRAAQVSRLDIAAGNQQRAVQGTAFPERIRVRVSRPDETPVAGVEMEFSVEPGPSAAWGPWGIADPHTSVRVTTDAMGYAEAPALYAYRGLGEGSVRARILDPASREYVTVFIRFTNTYADGSTFASFQDIWWAGPAENGWGLTVTQGCSGLFNVVYAYDASGRPTWWMASHGQWLAGLGSVSHGDVYSPTSAPYFAYDASKFTLGERVAFLALSSDDPMRMDMYMGGLKAPEPTHLTRFLFGQGGTSPVQGVGGMWWGGPSQNGWGLAVVEQPGALFIVWFTYDAAGKPVWFVMSDGRWSDANTWSGTIYRTSSSPWAGVAYNAAQFGIQANGTFELRFDGTEAATFTYDMEGHRGTLPLLRFSF